MNEPLYHLGQFTHNYVKKLYNQDVVHAGEKILGHYFEQYQNGQINPISWAKKRDQVEISIYRSATRE